MGGQACVFYGAAEFSRDIDLAILADSRNLARLKTVLDELQAEPIAVPPFALKHLRAGHAVHFRCQHPEARRMRLDIMSKMRGVDPFPVLWKRRTTIELPDGAACDLLSLPDLVQAKKTQRDKDWPMIRRLVEAHYFQNQESPVPEQIEFWLEELRTPQLLIEVAALHPGEARKTISRRSLLRSALAKNIPELERGLLEEENVERTKDRLYWRPLKEELESLRHRKIT